MTDDWIDIQGTFRISVEAYEATGLNTLGRCDPYAVMFMENNPKNEKKTKALRDTTFPKWMESFEFDVVDIKKAQGMVKIFAQRLALRDTLLARFQFDFSAVATGMKYKARVVLTEALTEKELEKKQKKKDWHPAQLILKMRIIDDPVRGIQQGVYPKPPPPPPVVAQQQAPQTANYDLCQQTSGTVVSGAFNPSPQESYAAAESDIDFGATVTVTPTTGGGQSQFACPYLARMEEEHETVEDCCETPLMGATEFHQHHHHHHGPHCSQQQQQQQQQGQPSPSFEDDQQPQLSLDNSSLEENDSVFVDSPTSPRGDPTSAYYKRLEVFYQRYCPEKLYLIGKALKMYEGKEEELFARLVEAYGPEPADTTEKQEETANDPTSPYFEVDKGEPLEAGAENKNQDEDVLILDDLEEEGEPNEEDEPYPGGVAAVCAEAEGREEPPAEHTEVPVVGTASAEIEREVSPPLPPSPPEPTPAPVHAVVVPPVAPIAPAPPQTQSQPPRSYRDRLTAFYTHYAPFKLNLVDPALQQYQGREEELLSALAGEYGPEPLANGAPPALESVSSLEPRVRLIRFYRQYAPEKLDIVDDALQQYQGRQEELFAALTKHYGPEPGTPAAAALTGSSPSPSSATGSSPYSPPPPAYGTQPISASVQPATTYSHDSV